MTELLRFHQYRPMEILPSSGRKSVGVSLFPPESDEIKTWIVILNKLCSHPKNEQLPSEILGVNLKTLGDGFSRGLFTASSLGSTHVALTLLSAEEIKFSQQYSKPSATAAIGHVMEWLDGDMNHHLSDLYALLSTKVGPNSKLTRADLTSTWASLGWAYILTYHYRDCWYRLPQLFPTDHLSEVIPQMLQSVNFDLAIKACHVISMFVPSMRDADTKVSALTELKASDKIKVIDRLLARPLCLPEGITKPFALRPRGLKLPDVQKAQHCDCRDEPKVLGRDPERGGKVKRSCPRLELKEVADLFVVREELLRYEEGDVAYIENILAGEERVRRHRRLKTTESKTETELQVDRSEDLDHSVSDRSSLQQQIQKQEQEDFNLDAGVTATYAFGNGSSVGAHANVGLKKSKSKSMNIARNHARDVVTKAVSKLQEKTRRLEFKRVVEEVEEKNKHTIDNKGAEAVHKAGIFYWVNKVTKAQVYGYGRRLVLTMYLPEPAATYRWLKGLNNNNKTDDPPSAPKISPKEIEADNYYELLKEHGVFDPVLPPPAKTITLSMSLSEAVNETSSKNAETASINSEIASALVPDGYACNEITSFAFTVGVGKGLREEVDGHVRDQAQYAISVAGHEVMTGMFSETEAPNQFFWAHLRDAVAEASAARDEYLQALAAIPPSGEVEAAWRSLLPADLKPLPYRGAGVLLRVSSEGPLPLTESVTEQVGLEISGFSTTVMSISGSMTYKCERTDAAMDEWRLEIYNLIMAEHGRKLTEFNDRRNQQEEAIELSFGQNPLVNRETERNELKRHIIALLMCNYFDGLGGIANGHCDLPEVDIDDMERNEPLIRFFEQVLEWTNMTYLFYPGYWARKCKWHELLEEDTGDPLFDKFLTAGAARVQVPLRPGLEGVFAYYLAENEIWAEGDVPPPIYSDAEYVSMIQEVKESTNGNFDEREGNIVATQDPAVVRLEGSAYYWDQNADDVHRPNIEDDLNRELLIDLEIYRVVGISQVDPEDAARWLIQLDRPFHRHEDKDATHLHSFGAVFVGAPWEVVIPTKLVYLQNPDDRLPTYPLTARE